MAMRLRSTRQVAPEVSQTRARRTSIYELQPEVVTRRERSRSRSRRYTYDARASNDEYPNSYYEGKVAEYERKLRLQWSLLLLLFLIVAHLLTRPVPEAMTTTTTLQKDRFNLPLSDEPYPHDYDEQREGLLIPAKRRVHFRVLDGIYEDFNLTIAHFGWVFESPYKALNYRSDSVLRNLHDSSNPTFQRNRRDLAKYVEGLVAPWREDGVLCAWYFFDKEVCHLAVERFEKHHRNLLDARFLSEWEEGSRV
jgi:hypothetical protein